MTINPVETPTRLLGYRTAHARGHFRAGVVRISAGVRSVERDGRQPSLVLSAAAMTVAVGGALSVMLFAQHVRVA